MFDWLLCNNSCDFFSMKFLIHHLSWKYITYLWFSQIPDSHNTECGESLKTSFGVLGFWFCFVLFFTCFCYHWVTLNGYFSSEKEWRMLCHGRKLWSPLVNVFEPSNLCCFLLCESSWLSHVKEKSLLYHRRNPSSGQWYSGLQNWFWVSLRASVAFFFCSGNTVKSLQLTKGSCVWGLGSSFGSFPMHY